MLIFDLETDGLLNDLTSIHCLVIYNTEDEKTLVFNDEGNAEPIVRGITLLEESDCIVGHNIIGYDNCAIKKCYPFYKPKGKVVDTLLLSRLFHPDLLKKDKVKQPEYMPVQLYGRHSLEAWGYRVKEYKGCFSKDTDWKTWSPEMQDYCIQDVNVTIKLCKHFHRYLVG